MTAVTTAPRPSVIDQLFAPFRKVVAAYHEAVDEGLIPWFLTALILIATLAATITTFGYAGLIVLLLAAVATCFTLLIIISRG